MKLCCGYEVVLKLKLVPSIFYRFVVRECAAAYVNTLFTEQLRCHLVSSWFQIDDGSGSFLSSMSSPPKKIPVEIV